MSTIESPTVEQVLDLAHKLSRQGRADLVSRLVQELANSPAPPAQTPPLEGLARFQAFAAEFRQRYPDADLTGRLEADRRDRDASLRAELGLDDEVVQYPH